MISWRVKISPLKQREKTQVTIIRLTFLKYHSQAYENKSRIERNFSSKRPDFPQKTTRMPPLPDEKTSAVACLPAPLSFFVRVLRPCYLRFQITKTKAFCKYTIFTAFQAGISCGFRVSVLSFTHFPARHSV